MKLGDRILSKGTTGSDVVELQMRLSGFRGTLWDGDFGPGTELQVVAFQRGYLGISSPSGIFDPATYEGLLGFANQYPINFTPLLCECGVCSGFGQGRFKGEYAQGSPAAEAYHRYEYPGIHKAILHAYRAFRHFTLKAGFGDALITCGYRCTVRNEQKNRSTTNHMGKAIDCDFALKPGEDKRDDANRCNASRGILVEKSGFQTGWGAQNRKALEPSELAPTWVHMDVRAYAPEYLKDEYFVKNAGDLDG